jgi:hypothetical protein
MANDYPFCKQYTSFNYIFQTNLKNCNMKRFIKLAVRPTLRELR